MQRLREKTRRIDRAGLSRAARRAYRPRSEELEDRALMALFPGNPMTETLTPFLGSSTSLVSTQTALNNFKAATGAAGTKTITWDGVKLDGTTAPDTPPNITVINVNKTVGIPLNRFQAAAGV